MGVACPTDSQCVALTSMLWIHTETTLHELDCIWVVWYKEESLMENCYRCFNLIKCCEVEEEDCRE